MPYVQSQRSFFTQNQERSDRLCQGKNCRRPSRNVTPSGTAPPQQDEVELFKRQKEAEAIRAKAVPEAEGIDIRTLIAGALGAKIAEP